MVMELSNGLKEKIEKLENTKQYCLGDKFVNPNRIVLCHGLRFQPLEKLEGILQTGYILPGKNVNQRFKNYMGKDVDLNIYNYDNENANHGEYISVMPYVMDSLEFEIFIASNLFLVLNGNIKARETFYLNYDEYAELMESKIKLKNLYSYALDEYLVKNPISIDNIVELGIYSYKINIPEDKLKIFIQDVVNILKFYNVNFKFIDFSTNEVYYEKNKKYLR